MTATMTNAQRRAAEKRLLTELRKHKGEWVAVRDSRVVACAPTRRQLRDKVDLRGIDAYFEVTPDEATVNVL